MLLAGGAVVAQSLANGLAHFMTEQEAQVVLLVECQVIVDGVLPSQNGPCIPGIRHIGGRRRLVASCRLVVVILADAAVAAVDRELRLHGKSLQRGNLQVGTTQVAGALDVALKVVALVHQGIHMGGIPHVGSLVDAAVFLVGLRDAGHLASGIEHRGIAGIVATIGESHRTTHLEVLVDDMVDIQAPVVAVHLVVLQQSLVVHSSQRQAEVGLLVAAANAGLIVLRRGVLQNGVVPVGIVAIINKVYHFVFVVAGNGS